MEKSILVVGAGVIGSIYALRFAKAGYTVTIAARGERLAALRADGLTIRQTFLDETETADAAVSDAVPAGASFGLVFVVLRSGQIEAALGEIRDKQVKGPVFVVGNNLGDLRAQAETVGPERFVLGFGAFGGYRDGSTVVYLDGRTAEKPGPENRSKTHVGIISEGARGACDAVEAALTDAGMPYDEVPDIAAWLVCHAALVFPLAGAMYATGGDQARFCRTRDAILLGIRACKEALASLARQGIRIEPKNLRSLVRVPEWALVRVLRKGLAGEAARVAMFGHANAPGGRNEISGQARVLDGILRRSDRALPSWDRLLPYFEPAVSGESLIPDGARSLRMRVW